MSALHTLAAIPSPRGALAAFRALSIRDRSTVLNLRARRRAESIDRQDHDSFDLCRGRRGMGQGYWEISA